MQITLIMVSWLKLPICNLTFVLDGLYKWTCLHMCWQYQSRTRLNDLLINCVRRGTVVMPGAKNRSSDFWSYDLDRRQTFILSDIKYNPKNSMILNDYVVHVITSFWKYVLFILSLVIVNRKP